VNLLGLSFLIPNMIVSIKRLDILGKGVRKGSRGEGNRIWPSNINVTRYCSRYSYSNERSCKLLKKVGMKFEKRLERFGELESVFSIQSFATLTLAHHANDTPKLSGLITIFRPHSTITT
jgi:hypothetical protein